MKFGKAGKNKHAEKINLLKGKPALEDTEKQDIRTEDIKDDGIYELELSPSIMPENKPVESPFIFRKGLKIKSRDSNEITMKKYMKMDEKGNLTITDRLILKELVRLNIATSRNLKIVLGCDSIKSELKFLINNGLVKKFYFSYPSGEEEVKTVDFYAPAETVRKVRNIGVSPFSKLKLFDVPYMYRMKKTELGQKFVIIPLCSRRNPKWRAEQFNNMINIVEICEIEFKGYTPLFIVNVEDNSMACESEAGKSGYQQLKSVPIFYVSDWVVNNSTI